MGNRFCTSSCKFTHKDIALTWQMVEIFTTDITDETPQEHHARLHTISTLLNDPDIKCVHYDDWSSSAPQSLLQTQVNEKGCEKLSTLECQVLRELASHSHLPLEGPWDDSVLTVCLTAHPPRYEMLDALLFTRRCRFACAEILHARRHAFPMPKRVRSQIWHDLLQENLPPYFDKPRPLSQIKGIEVLEAYLDVDLQDCTVLKN